MGGGGEGVRGKVGQVAQKNNSHQTNIGSKLTTKLLSWWFDQEIKSCSKRLPNPLNPHHGVGEHGFQKLQILIQL